MFGPGPSRSGRYRVERSFGRDVQPSRTVMAWKSCLGHLAYRQQDWVQPVVAGGLRPQLVPDFALHFRMLPVRPIHLVRAACALEAAGWMRDGGCDILSLPTVRPDFLATAISPLTPRESFALLISISDGQNPAFRSSPARSCVSNVRCVSGP